MIELLHLPFEYDLKDRTGRHSVHNFDRIAFGDQLVPQVTLEGVGVKLSPLSIVGNFSAYFDGNSGLFIPDRREDWLLGSTLSHRWGDYFFSWDNADFTIDFWICLQRGGPRWYGVCGSFALFNGFPLGWFIWVDTLSNKLQLFFYREDRWDDTCCESADSIPWDYWTHIAIVSWPVSPYEKDGRTVRSHKAIYINGRISNGNQPSGGPVGWAPKVLVSSRFEPIAQPWFVISNAFSSQNLPLSHAPFFVGVAPASRYTASPRDAWFDLSKEAYFLKGYIDSLRICKGVRFFEANSSLFTPPDIIDVFGQVLPASSSTTSTTTTVSTTEFQWSCPAPRNFQVSKKDLVYTLSWFSDFVTTEYELEVKYDNQQYIPLGTTSNTTYRFSNVPSSVTQVQFRIRAKTRRAVSEWVESIIFSLVVYCDFELQFRGSRYRDSAIINDVGASFSLECVDMVPSPGSRIVSWEWRLYNKSVVSSTYRTLTGKSVTAYYDKPGLYAIGLFVEDSSGKRGSCIKEGFLEVGCRIYPDFVATVGSDVFTDVATVYPKTILTFEDRSLGDEIAVRRWIFHEGSTRFHVGEAVFNAKPSRSYNFVGDFAVTLEVTGIYGQKASITKPGFVRVIQTTTTPYPTSTTTVSYTTTESTTEPPFFYDEMPSSSGYLEVLAHDGNAFASDSDFSSPPWMILDRNPRSSWVPSRVASYADSSIDTVEHPPTPDSSGYLFVHTIHGRVICDSESDWVHRAGRVFDRSLDSYWCPGNVRRWTTTTTTTTATTTSETTSFHPDLLLPDRDIWPEHSDIFFFRQNFVRRVVEEASWKVPRVKGLPKFDPSQHQGFLLFEEDSGQFFLGISDRWCPLRVSYIPHVVSHLPGGSDPFILMSDKAPLYVFDGQIWIDISDLSTTTTTTVTTTTTTLPPSGNIAYVGILGYPECSSFVVDHECFKAFDENPSTYWKAGQPGPAWIGFTWETPRVIQKYIIQVFDTLEGAPVRWTLRASRNLITWVTLDSRNNEIWTGRRVYGMTNFTDYKAYRLFIDLTYDGSPAQIISLEMFERY